MKLRCDMWKWTSYLERNQTTKLQQRWMRKAVFLGFMSLSDGCSQVMEILLKDAKGVCHSWEEFDWFPASGSENSSNLDVAAGCFDSQVVDRQACRLKPLSPSEQGPLVVRFGP